MKDGQLMTLTMDFKETATWLKSHYPPAVDVVAVLGSGLGDLADQLIACSVQIPYSKIPHFMASKVAGHSGNLILGQLPSGLHLACFQGRVHYYEGHPMESVVYPLRVMRLLGAKTLILTNSAGGVNPALSPGDLMLITDHINLMGTNPLIGGNQDEFGPRFPDMSEVYSASLRTLALSKAEGLSIDLKQGVYCAMSGPSYETPAEIRMIKTLGGDAVGMSTVPEAIVGSHMGMKVLGFSCITNAAAGVTQGHLLNHAEVLEAAENAKPKFSQLLSSVLMALPNE